MTHFSMKRSYDTNEVCFWLQTDYKESSFPYDDGKRPRVNPRMPYTFSGIQFPSHNQEKRDIGFMETNESKRLHCNLTDTEFCSILPTDVVKKLAFSPQSFSLSTQLPECAIREMEDEAYR